MNVSLNLSPAILSLTDIAPKTLLSNTELIIKNLKNIFNEFKVYSPELLKIIPVLKNIYNLFIFFLNKINLFRDVHPDEIIRNTCLECNNIIDKYIMVLDSDIAIYETFKKLILLTHNQTKKFIENLIINYENSGILSKNHNKLKKINKKIIKLTNEYERNIINNNTKLNIKKTELTGVPEYFLNNLEHKGEDYIIPITPPNVNFILKNCDVEETRKKIGFINKSRCEVNIPILYKIIKLRKNYANLLKYDNYVDFILKNRMAKNKKNVDMFLNKIKEKSINQIKTYNELLESVGFNKKSFNLFYYIEQIKKIRFNINENEIKQYFPLENVLKEMFVLFKEIFNIEIIKKDKKDLWHPDIILYLVKRGGVDIGMIYMDLYTRNDKFEYFACFPLISKITGSPAVPSCGLICNFSKLNDCLLNHREIEILFHEFGHIMHHIFGEAEYAILSSINTELDYCEIPSQILENLAWEPDIIKKLSRHYKTGNKLSDIHISNIIKSRILYNDLSHQLFYSLFDQKIYDLNFSSHKEMVDKFISLRSKVENVETINTELGLFIHMVGEYGGAYYTYLWGLEYANKIYKFLKDNPNKWDKYVDTMLKPGGTIDGEIMISNFFKD